MQYGDAMAIAPEIIDLQTRATKAKLDMSLVLAHAGVAETTWWRWNSGAVEPRLATIRRLRSSLDELAPRRKGRKVQ